MVLFQLLVAVNELQTRTEQLLVFMGCRGFRNWIPSSSDSLNVALVSPKWYVQAAGQSRMRTSKYLKENNTKSGTSGHWSRNVAWRLA